jgi:hypothetical protein
MAGRVRQVPLTLTGGLQKRKKSVLAIFRHWDKEFFSMSETSLVGKQIEAVRESEASHNNAMDALNADDEESEEDEEDEGDSPS